MREAKQSGQKEPTRPSPGEKQHWPHRSELPAFWISAIYLAASLVWILLSDRILFMMVTDQETLIRISNYKGYGFVFASALLIWWLVFRALHRLHLANRDLSAALASEQRLGEELARRSEELAHRNEEIERAHGQLLKKNETLQIYQRSIRDMLYVDGLTGLPNRRSLRKYLDSQMDFIPRRPLSMCYLDLDNFKLVNDVHGHSQGDAYLRAIAARMRALLHPGWQLFRLGGDEFVCCLGREASIEELEKTAAELRDACSLPVLLDGVSVHGTVSLGIARYPEHGETAEELLKHADIAMYGAKHAGRNLSLLYHTRMAESVARRFSLETALRTALEQQEFHVVYQPQLELRSGRILGFEALLRWRSPVLGNVSPAEFIPVAEEARQILPIGLWVFQTACRFLANLKQDGFHRLSLSVNVSMLQLLQHQFTQDLCRITDETGVSPAYIQLEITESILMQSREQVLPVLHSLREHGFRISLDDFGQGYSSLSYLMSMPIQVLKIDKRFVDAIGLPGPGESVLGAILELGRLLRLQTVAEGVETEDQQRFLLSRQCDCMQGYLFSKPLSGEAALELLRQRQYRDGTS